MYPGLFALPMQGFFILKGRWRRLKRRPRPRCRRSFSRCLKGLHMLQEL